MKNKVKTPVTAKKLDANNPSIWEAEVGGL